MGSRGSAWTAAACRRCVCVPHPAPGLPSNRTAWRTNGLLTDPRPAVTTAFNTGPPSGGSQSPVRMRLIAAATSDLTEPVRLWLAGRLATAQQAGALQTLREFGGALPGRGSAWSAAACRRCGRWAGVNSGLPAGCDQHGLNRGARCSRSRRAAARGETVAQQGRCVRGHQQQRNPRTPQRRKEGLAVRRRIRAAGRVCVRGGGPVSFRLRPGSKLCWVWRLSGATSASPCRLAEPPRQGGQKLKCGRA